MNGVPASGRRTDVRLAGGAIVGEVAVAGCLGWPPALVLAVAAAALVVGGSLAVLPWVGSLVRTAALVLLCIALVLLPLAFRGFAERSSVLTVAARRHAAVLAELVVTGDPQPLAASGLAGAPRVMVATSAKAIWVDGRRQAAGGHVAVIAPLDGWRALLPGQRVRASVALAPPVAAGPVGVTGFARGSPALVGRPPWWQRAAGAMRADLHRACGGLPAPERGLLPGLIVGDTSHLDPVLRSRFKVAGLTHLVAVSGTNCSILLGTVLLALRRGRARPWLQAAAGAAVLVMFVFVARPSPSVLRAAGMALVALAALASGRPRQGVPALGAVVLALLAYDPLLARDPGFLMSVLATGSLLLLAPPLTDALVRRRVPAVLAAPVAVAAAAHLVTAPVVAAISGRVSLVAIPANVLAEPAVAVTTVLGFAAAALAPLWLPAGAFAAQAAGWPTRWLVHVADLFGGLHGATLPWPAGLAGGLGLAAMTVGLAWLVLRIRPFRRPVLAAALLAVVMLIPVRAVVAGWPPSGWLFVACDVGQGDGLVLDAGGGAAVVVDAGPEPVAMDRCLHDLGVRTVPLLAFTHLHLDHVGGIAGVLHGRAVGHVVTGPLREPAAGLHVVSDALRARRLTLGSLPDGATLDIGDVQLDLLGPRAAFHGTRSDPNNSSLVLRATVGGVRILLAADAEIEAQQSLLDQHADVTADVLKVPHHGSAYSLPSFLAAVHAGVGVISVGLHNDYGHPAPVLLADLDRLGLVVRRTDRDGDVAIAGARHHVTAVARGTRSSTIGLGAPGSRAGGRAAPASVVDDRMAACRAAPSRSTTCPSRFRPSFSSSGTRSSSSPGRSARSPPRPAAPTPAWW